MKLTPAQVEILSAVRLYGPKYFNMRRDKAVRALVALKKVTAELVVLSDSKRGTALFWLVSAIK